MKSFGWAWICLNTIQLEVKEVIKTKIKVEIWRMQSLGVALVLEFKAKDKTEEIQIRSWKEIKMDELSVMVKFENWRNYGYRKLKLINLEMKKLEYSENWICWCLKVETQ